MKPSNIISNDDVINATFKILIITSTQESELHITKNPKTIYWRYVEVADRLFPVYRESVDSKIKEKLQDVIRLCISRAEVLQKSIKENEPLVIDRNIPAQIHFHVAQYYVEKAYYLDSRRMSEDSLDYYIKAIGSLISCKKLGGNVNEKATIVPLMNRAEQIKGIKSTETKSTPSSSSPSNVITNSQQNRPQQKQSSSSGRAYEKSEIEVLIKTSKISGIKFLPYIHSVDRKERFYYNDMKFNDPDGKLILSDSQKKHNPNWKRPHQFLSRPVMVQEISPFTITQSVVTDCSFVSSLIVTSNYERRFGKPLISNCIFPQNSKGVPLYNPDGKYMVRLYFNGAWRKVIIDDYFPVDGYTNNWLCSHSTNKDELWISIIEKAFIKINGGYSFPGSNSGIDLHNLTGWIPESHKTQKEGFDRNGQWIRLFKGYRLGQCLATISTGPPSDRLDNVGLSDGHAYAIIDAREIDGLKLLQVKNPWRKKRWKGKFSPSDVDSWTPSLRSKLNYDILGELQFDNGVFWIDWESVCLYFENLHYSWNPKMFQYQSNYVSSWPLGKRPFCGSDERFVGRSPQFKLEIRGRKGNHSWVMITKHTKTIEDDQEYLSILIYPSTNGERLHHRRTSSSPGPVNKVVYTNSKHKKHCIVSEKEGVAYYTIVVSQYERIKTIDGFSINVFSQSECKISPLPFPQVSTFIRGKWVIGVTAAGSVNHTESYKKNPQILMKFVKRSRVNRGRVRLTLESMSKETFINIICFTNEGKKVELPTTDITYASSGKYTPGYTEIIMENPDPGVLYTIVVSTYEQGIEDSFLLAAEAERGAIVFSFL